MGTSSRRRTEVESFETLVQVVYAPEADLPSDTRSAEGCDAGPRDASAYGFTNKAGILC